MNTKTCSKCAQVKDLVDFAKDKNNKDGRSYWCKACHCASTRKYLKNNADKVYMRKYGITKAQYDAMYQAADGKCEICKQPFPVLCVDHCHKTKTVRGVLCRDCNLGLGGARDDVNILQKAIAYLEEHK